MARTAVFLVLPGEREARSFRTDLGGQGNVCVGEEFIARELCPTEDRLIKDGRKLRVRVVRVEVVHRSYHLLHVAVLQDLSPPSDEQELF